MSLRIWKYTNREHLFMLVDGRLDDDYEYFYSLRTSFYKVIYIIDYLHLQRISINI